MAHYNILSAIISLAMHVSTLLLPFFALTRALLVPAEGAWCLAHLEVRACGGRGASCAVLRSPCSVLRANRAASMLPFFGGVQLYLLTNNVQLYLLTNNVPLDPWLVFEQRMCVCTI